MQSVSANYGTATADVMRSVAYKLQIMWGDSGWTDETAYMDIDFSGSLAIAAPGDDLIAPGSIGSFSFTLDNSTRRFDPANTNSPIYANISGNEKLAYKPVKLEVAMGGLNEWVTIFTGVIANWTPTEATARVAITARDMGWKLLQNKASTAIYSDALSSQLASTLATAAGATSTVETGLFRIPYAWLDDESYLEEVWQIAQSEGAMCYFDSLGTLQWKNIVSLAGNTTLRWTFHVDDWQDVSPSYDTEELVSKVVCEWSARVPAAEAVVYTLDEIKTIMPGQFIDIEARFTNPVATLIAPVGEDAKDYYIASSAGSSLGSSITVAVQETFGQRATIRVTNNHATLSAVIYKLQLRGYPLVGGPEDQVSVSASNPAVTNRVRSVRGNPYIQTEPQARMLATVLAERLKRFVPIYAITGVPGVPHLELTDYITVTTESRSVSGWVQRIDFRSEGGAFVQDVRVMDAANFYDYSGNYFKIGVTALGGNARAWH